MNTYDWVIFQKCGLVVNTKTPMYVIYDYTTNTSFLEQDIDTETKYRDFFVIKPYPKRPRLVPLITSDHETTPSSCISHYLNVSVTYKEEADILPALSYLHGDRGKIPDDKCTFFFRNKEMRIEFFTK